MSSKLDFLHCCVFLRRGTHRSSGECWPTPSMTSSSTTLRAARPLQNCALSCSIELRWQSMRHWGPPNSQPTLEEPRGVAVAGGRERGESSGTLTGACTPSRLRSASRKCRWTVHAGHKGYPAYLWPWLFLEQAGQTCWALSSETNCEPLAQAWTRCGYPPKRITEGSTPQA